MNRLLIDTNILVYGLDEESEYFDRSRKIINNNKYQLVTTSKNLIEFVTVATKANGYNLQATTVLDILEDILQGIEIIYPSHLSIEIFLSLFKTYQPKGLKVHDFEIMSIGLAHNIHEIATFNSKDFKGVKEITLLNF